MGAKIILKDIAILILAAALSSCHRKVEVEQEEYTPLSKAALDLSSGAQWAYEIEGNRLDKKIDSFEAISKSVVLSSLSMIALDAAYPMPSVYPELNGFGSLDTSSVQGELLETVKEFCLAMLEYSKGAREYDKYQAELKAAKKNAAKSSSDSSDSQEGQGENVPQKDSSKIDALFSSRSLFSLALFLADSSSAGVLQSFVIGRPFVGEEVMEIPVRWIGQKEILDTFLYPVQEGETWKVQQIEIYKSEAKNGSVKADRN